MMIVGGAALALVVLVTVALLAGGNRKDASVAALASVEPAPTSPPQAQDEAPVQAPEATAEPEPTPASASAPEQAVAQQRALTRPSATAPGFLPVFHRSNTEERIIAITVDDCYQANNLRQIVDKAMEVGAKLTIFPIGENVIRTQQSEILRYAWENGFELENHTFTHNGLYACSGAELAEEVYKQQLALSYILGVEYQCHFLRPKGGDARGDQRIHQYAGQMGYYGIAHWSNSGAADYEKLTSELKPGAIYLFHTTDKDLDKLLRFIPWVAEQGYQMVTLNEMFGYPPNETSELTVPINEHVIPELQPYEIVYVPLKKTTYSWNAYLLQEKLIELGYLSGEPDGVYGKGCEAAVKAYQRDHGLTVTGVADPELQRMIFSS